MAAVIMTGQGLWHPHYRVKEVAILARKHSDHQRVLTRRRELFEHGRVIDHVIANIGVKFG
jgi:hypothetical protein